MANVPAGRGNAFATLYGVANSLMSQVGGPQQGSINQIAQMAAMHHASLDNQSHQAELQETALANEHNRRMQFFDSILKHAQSETAVSFKHRDMSLSLTKSPTSPGRVPVKKNRGGKKKR
jgi:hypothetical protein